MTSKINQTKCRVCICELNATAGSYDLLEQPMLSHKFTTCTDLSIEKDERIPCKLCQACYDQLNELYAFRARCIASDLHWRNKILEENLIHKVNGPQYEDLPEMNISSPKKILSKGQDVYKITQCNSSAPSYKCDICSMRFLVEHRLIAHKRQHEGLMPYPCTEDGCARAFNRRHCLTEHQKQHTDTSRWFSCDQDGCPKQYRHKPTLIMHQRKCHKLGPELKSHVCEFCGKIFSSTAVLNDHRLTHKDKSELPHACQEPNCSRRFSSKEKLKVHMMRHAGIKNFRCPYCGMRKTTRNELKIHMNYHTLERTWPCRFCSKVCHSSGNLQMHVRTVHEGARDYACSYCERSFAKADTRKYHEMTHTGEKPNKCEECGKCFTQPAALRTHRKIHERQRKAIESKSTAYTIVITAPVDATAAAVGIMQTL